MIMENDTYKLPEKYRNMSLEEIKKEEEKILKKLNKKKNKIGKSTAGLKKKTVAGTTFLL